MEFAVTKEDIFINILPYLMAVGFVVGCLVRFLVYHTVGRHEDFAKEFEKRVNKFIESEVPGKQKNVSFYVLSKKLLEQTFYEVFQLRERMRRRKNDGMMSFSDRIFLIKQGCAWLVKDILKQLKFLKWTDETPKLLNITKATFHHNPCFNRVFGIIPINVVNDLASIMPGLFVVAGILGTFVGIAKGLPALGGMNLTDVENTKNIMDRFLNEIAFAMRSSIAGISFSLAMHIWNTIFSPDRAYVSMIDRFEGALNLLWYRADNNEFPLHERKFDEHRDPSEALAEESIESEVAKLPRSRDFDRLKKAK